MNRPLLLILASIALLLPRWAAAGAAKAAPPNVVLFLADDLGWGDLTCYGHPTIQTPNLDRFAKEGVRFTQCYSACGVCSPSRSAILTGRTPYRNGVYRWIRGGSDVYLRTSEVAFPKLLKEKGYQTCHVGKWHLNGKFNQPALQPQPDAHGFDHWMATQNNAAPNHKNPTNFVRNGERVGPMEGYSAPLVVDEAISWLKGRKADQPFYLQVWTHEPHAIIETDPQFMAPYEEKIGDPDLRQHHGNVTQLDHAFGRLMQALDAMGLTGSTVVFFTSDNGPAGEGTSGRHRGSTGGLRGRKADDYEGGIRAPGIVRWPGKIRPGSTSDVTVLGTDIFNTVCEIADVPVPTDRVIDGGSMLPAFEGKPVTRARPMYWRTHVSAPECRVALRDGDWKIVGNDDLTRFELYNLKEDPKETKELSGTHPDKLAVMKKTLLELDAEIKAEGPDWWKLDPEGGWK
jgi:arylsulfatase A